MTSFELSSVTVQGPAPLQGPLHPVKGEWMAGLAVRTTCDPGMYVAEQTAPQSMRPSLLVTVPMPVPDFEMRKVGGVGVGVVVDVGVMVGVGVVVGVSVMVGVGVVVDVGVMVGVGVVVDVGVAVAMPAHGTVPARRAWLPVSPSSDQNAGLSPPTHSRSAAVAKPSLLMLGMPEGRSYGCATSNCRSLS